MRPGPLYYRCPQCGSAKYLWRYVMVEGWQDVDDRLEPVGRSQDGVEAAAWTQGQPTGIYGCAECGWEGHRDALAPADEGA